MNLGQTFQRFFNDWQKFAWMGLGAFIVQLVGSGVLMVLGLAMMGPAILSLLRSGLFDIASGPDIMLRMMGNMAALLVVSVIVGVLMAGLTYAGLIGSVVAYRRGEEVNLSTFWSYARQYFGQMILLGIILFGIMLVSMILMIIPVLGWIAYFIWVPTAVATLNIYPSYLVIHDGYSVGDAMGAGFRVLRSAFMEALIAGLIVLVFSVAFGLIGTVPLLGWIVVVLFGEPLMFFFLSERFECDVRPRLVT